MSNPTFPTPNLDRLPVIFELAPTAPLTQPMVLVLFRVLTLIHFVKDILPTTRPLCIPVGPPGSGKTTFARVVGTVVSGLNFNVVTVPTTERDFWPVVAAGHPVVFDNAEDPPKWLPNALATATSGAGSQSRKLYSNFEVVTLRAQGILWLTTFSAGIRGDLLDRSLIFRLDRPREFFPESLLWAELREALPRIQGQAEAASAEVRRRIAFGKLPRPARGTGRLADFAALGHLVAEVTGGPDDAALFDAAMQCMQAERDRLASDGYPMFAPLIDFARSEQNYDQTTETYGMWFTARFLLSVVSQGAGSGPEGFKATTQDVARFGKFLSDLVRTASGVLRIEQRTVNGVRLYRITLP